MPSQLELPITRAPSVSPEDVQRLVAVLEADTDWATAEILALRLGCNDRKVRKIAAAAMPQVVSFPGSPGYRLFQHCTTEEINHCIDSFESQAREMKTRAVLYLQAYHRRFRGKNTPL